jgi:hypothetical protein
MNCPNCFSEECKRSHREGFIDFLIGVSGLRPWRCRDCETRFFAWSVPIRRVHYVHCRQCGNLGVKRISREYVTGSFAWLFRILYLPAYRCAPCRYKFFSIRPLLRVASAARVPSAESAVARPR